MNNGIKDRENEQHSLKMLGAQRKLYNDAKTADTIRIFLSVWFPFALSFVLLFVSEDSAVGTISYSVSVLSVISSFFVEKYIKQKKKLAATIQQQFDVYVYNMPWNDRLFGKKKNLDHEVVEHSKSLFHKEGEKEKLLNWYPESVNDMPINEGIATCQRENCWWDAGLRKRYKAISIGIVITLTVIIVMLGVVNDENVVKLLWRAAFIAPMVQWLLDTIESLDDDLESLNELSDALNSGDRYQIDELQETQKLIFEHRKNCLAIPNIVYKIFKNNDEDKAHQIASL